MSGKGQHGRAQQLVREMFVEHSPDLLAFFRSSRRMTKSDATDLLQQTFEELLKAFERNPKFEIRHPRGFLFRIAHRRLYARVKGERRDGELMDKYAATGETTAAEADDLEYQASLRTEQRLLIRAMRRMSEPMGPGSIGEPQLLLYLRFFTSLTLAELAAVFDIPVGTVPGRLRRALRLLNERVEALDSPDAGVRHTSTTVLEKWRSALEQEAELLLTGEPRGQT